MAKCPLCGEEINHLRYITSWRNEYELTLDDDGKAETGNVMDEWPADDGRDVYKCPECDEPVAMDEESAVKVLSEGGR